MSRGRGSRPLSGLSSRPFEENERCGELGDGGAGLVALPKAACPEWLAAGGVQFPEADFGRREAPSPERGMLVARSMPAGPYAETWVHAPVGPDGR